MLKQSQSKAHTITFIFPWPTKRPGARRGSCVRQCVQELSLKGRCLIISAVVVKNNVKVHHQTKTFPWCSLRQKCLQISIMSALKFPMCNPAGIWEDQWVEFSFRRTFHPRRRSCHIPQTRTVSHWATQSAARAWTLHTTTRWSYFQPASKGSSLENVHGVFDVGVCGGRGSVASVCAHWNAINTLKRFPTGGFKDTSDFSHLNSNMNPLYRFL